MKTLVLTFLLIATTSYAGKNIDTINLNLDYNKYSESFESSIHGDNNYQVKTKQKINIKPIKITKSEQLRKKLI